MIARSRATREAYLALIRGAASDGPMRGKLQCANFAHGVAGCGTEDKNSLRMMNAANVAIVSSYNDMLSAHQPYEHFPEQIKKALREVGSVGQFAGGTPAMCDGVTQGEPGMELSLLSREVIAMSTAVALSHNMFDAALMLESKPVVGQFLIDLRLPDGRWLQVDAREEQGWTSTSPLDLLFDYVMRIYLLRVLVLVVIALVAVRLAIRPLNALAKAAEALGRDIQRPPLSESGPTEVRRAAQAFNAMQQRLIANIAERTRFLAAISHDLRSPITRLRLRTEMLDDNRTKERFRSDLEEMEHMVSSTLDFVSSGEINEARQNIDINALLQSLQADLEDVGHSVRIEGRAKQPLPGYARSLKRCVQNLLENAVRYGCDVVVRVEDQAGSLKIVISDRGPGIPQEQLEQVMEPFYRVEGSRNAETGGQPVKV